MKLLVSAEKPTTLVSKMTLCVKAVINVKDKCSLNGDKYHYESILSNNQPVDMD